MKFIACSIVLLFSTVGYCQNDNLEGQIKSASHLGREYQVAEVYDSALYYSHLALKLARKSKNKDFIFSELLKVSAIESDTGLYDSSIKRLLEAEDLGTNKSNSEGMNWSFARLFIGMGAPNLALNTLMKFPNSREGTIAKLYISVGKNGRAIYYYRKVMEENKGEANYHTYNNLGVAYAGDNNIDSALHYYNKALEEYYNKVHKTNSDTFMFGMINGNMGSIYTKKNLFKKAIPHLKIDFETSERYNEYDIHVRVGELLYRAYYNAGEKKNADRTVENLQSYKDVSMESQLSILRTELLHYKDKENAQEYDKRFKHYQLRTDEYIATIKSKNQAAAEILSANRIKQINTDLKLQEAISKEAQSKMETAQQEEKSSKLMTALIALAAVFLLIVVILFFNYRRKHTKIKSDLLEMELRYKKSEMTDFAINLNRNNNFNVELVSQIKQLKTASGDERSQQLNELSIFVNQHLNTGNTLEIFQQNVDQVNKAFFEKLTMSFPFLTQNEKELCGLIRLNLSNKEIATIKNISTQSARTSRYRLKKRLNLSQETDISSYISSI